MDWFLEDMELDFILKTKIFFNLEIELRNELEIV